MGSGEVQKITNGPHIYINSKLAPFSELDFALIGINFMHISNF